VNDSKNPSPNLSPKRREALKPPFPSREGGLGGLGLSDVNVTNNTFKTLASKAQLSTSKAQLLASKAQLPVSKAQLSASKA
jgi:hypothetical protein